MNEEMERKVEREMDRRWNRRCIVDMSERSTEERKGGRCTAYIG